jgi:hypothetical protein
VHLAGLAGLLVGVLALALPPVPDRWPALPLLSWLATSASLAALWLWWRRRQAEGHAAKGTDWSQLPVPLAPIYFAVAAAETALIVGLLLVFVRLIVNDLPTSIVELGAGSGATAWLCVFALWLWWPQRRRLASRRRCRRREAKRRLAAIRRSGSTGPREQRPRAAAGADLHPETRNEGKS